MINCTIEEFESCLSQHDDSPDIYDLWVSCPSDIGWEENDYICGHSDKTCKDCWLEAFRKMKEGS